jgi:hypothetical protein
MTIKFESSPVDAILQIVTQDTSKELPPNLNQQIREKRYKSDLEKGHEHVDNVRELLSRFDTWKGPRMINQLWMLEGMLIACAGLFYALVMDSEMAEILARNMWKRIVQLCAISAPRREGKTEICALFAAAMLYYWPNCNILLLVPYSGMGNLQSGLLGRTKDFLEGIFKVSTWTAKNSKMIQFQRGTPRTMRCEFQK